MTRIFALILLTIFYSAYFYKNRTLRRQNIVVDQLGRGKKQTLILILETVLKTLTFATTTVQLFYMFYNDSAYWIGLPFAAIGVIIFIVSIVHMGTSWRAGIPSEPIKLVTNGIYKFSRNPAFVGFDLLFIGLLLSFPNRISFTFVALTIITFHIQILSEEKYLVRTFGIKYKKYKSAVRRYF